MRSIAMVLAVCLLACAKGDAGEPGPPGAEGPQGAPGDDGNPGLAGTDGTDGMNGRQGPVGMQGPQGDPGSVGPQGPLGTGTWVWKDANGMVVPALLSVFQLGGNQVGQASTRPLFIDTSGYIWAVNAETLSVGETLGNYFGAWESTDCSGVEYASNSGNTPLPRFTFNYATDNTTRVRNDGAVATTINIGSISPGSGCQAFAGGPTTVLALTDTTIIPSTSVPNLSTYTPPLHPEL